MSLAIRRALLILTRKEAAALLTISSDTTSSGNVGGCLHEKKRIQMTVLKLKTIKKNTIKGWQSYLFLRTA